MGGDYFALCLALEELARVDSSVAITLEAAVSLGAMPIYRFGTEEQKRAWLPQLCAGEMLGAFGLTEPGGGSDAGGTRTTARLSTDGTSGSSTAPRRSSPTPAPTSPALVTVTAVTGTTAGRPQGDLRDHRAGRHARVHGRRRSTPRSAGTPPTPASCRSPTAGCPPRTCWASAAAATRSSCSMLDEGRIAIAALGVGLAQGCVDESRAATPGSAQAFGRPIGDYQAIAVQDRRHGGAGAHRPAGLLRRRGPDAARRAVQEAGRDRQALLLGDAR